MKTLATRERVARVGPKRQVVIPREILEALDLRAGDLVSFAERRNGVLITPKRAPRIVAETDDTLTSAEEKIVRRAEAEFKRGESKSWRAVKNALSL